MASPDEAADLEAALGGVAGVGAVAVCVAERAATQAPCLVVFVVGAARDDELRAALRAHAPDDAAAAALLRLEALPRTPHGEVDRRALADRAAELAASLQPPRSATEVAVAAIWQQLGCTPATVDDDFFLAGGHSLLAAQLGARLTSLFELEVPLPVLFDGPTVAAQAAWIDRHAAHGRSRIERHAHPGAAPLSFAQERMWLFDELNPGTTVHHLQRAFRLTGPLDRPALRRALDAVARRHPALRTCFVRDRGLPRQQIAREATRDHRERDAVGELDADAIAAHCADELRRPFELARGPLWRTSLLELAPDAHVLVVTLHHLIADAWSLNVWTREVAEHYGAERAGRAPILERLELEPADVAAWQRRAVADGSLDPHRASWRTTLAGVAAGLELPADRPRPTSPSYRGHHVRLAIAPAVVERLRAVGRRRGCTLFVTVLAALDVLLARLSGQRDLIVGTPVGGRDRPETRGLIGLFLNTLPIRVDASGDPTFEALLERVRAATQHALAHAAVPYEQIVADLAPPREAGRHPVFDVMLNLVPPPEPFELAGLRATPLAGRNESGPLDLVVTLVEQRDGSLAGNLRCAADLFDARTAERLARRLETVIASVAAAPQLAISRATLLDDDERRLVSVAWNDTAVELPPLAVHELFAAQARRAPGALAVDDARGARRSYGELARRVDQIAGALRARDPAREALIGIHVERSLDLAASVLGVLSAGAAFVLLDPTLPTARLAAMLDDAAPRWIVTQRPLVATLPGAGAARVVLDDLDDALAAPRDHVAVRGDDLAYVMYTSGSTGRPKGVAVSHRALVNRLTWVRRTFPFAPGEVVCQKTAIGFVDTLWELLGPLADGLACVLPADAATRDPAALARILVDHGVTRMMLVPSLLRALLRAHRGATGWLPRLTLWLVGGEELPPDLAAAFVAARPDARLVNLYGLSEVAGEATWHEVRDTAGPRVPIGIPGPNCRAYVVEPHGELAPIGVWGELWIGGAGVARGYHGRTDDTRARFLDDPFHPPGRVLRTGDRARWRSDGAVELAGRLDTQVKIRGVRVEPAEVEQALRRHPAIHDAAVTAVRGPDGEHRLVAYVVPEAGPLPEPRELRQFLRASLAEAMVPTHVVALAALPLGPAGKVELGALPPPDLGLATAALQPLTATEAAVAEAWAAVLGGGPVGLDDDFFARGGYSLLVAQLAAELGRGFAIEISLAMLFEAPTIAGQAARIDAARRAGASWPALVAAPRAARMPLAFVQERMWLAEATRPGMPLHVLTIALRLRGALDGDHLERAMDAVAARHEALRTTFAADAGGPYQVIHPHGALARDRAMVDLSALTGAAQRAELARLQADDKVRPFDLAAGPPWRTRLVRLEAEIHVLIVAMHHLVSDGWSMHRWLEEVGAHYAAAPARAPALPELAVQPADVAVWQRRCLEAGAFDRARAYWRACLTPRPAAELPSDGPRDGTDGGWVTASLTPAHTARVRALARSENSSIFMVILAALDLLVAELTGDPDVTIGTLVAGRDHPLVRPLVGAFLNTLPVRANVASACSLAEVLPRVRDATRGALAHGEVPFDRIVADVNPRRTAGRNPLFDVALNYVPPGLPHQVGALTAELVDPTAVISAPFDVMWRVLERGDALQLRVEYRRGRFTAERVQGWLDRYLELLGAGADRPA
jgi:amino acid adenylation domain-containing protein